MKLARTSSPWTTFSGNLLSNFFNHDFDFAGNDFAPAVDVVENEKNFILKAELPGMKKEDIKLEINGNTLTMSGERHFDKEEKRENFHRVERSYGTFTRSFLLPNNVNVEKPDVIDAKLV